ncbi:MAG: hypothetical protein IPK74_11585 [Deltaproteobacteria bacterium]|nr:hypothetical protein [Deltaproteobacteria bacterium]
MLRRRRPLLLLAAVHVVLACDAAPADDGAASSDDGTPAEPRQLVDLYEFVAAPDERDLFRADKPDAIECPPIDGFGPIDFGGYPSFEVHTDFCDYITVEQPLLDDVHAGEHVNVRMWHFDLRAVEPAIGYAAVSIEGQVRWEYEVEIPSDGALASYGWVTDHDIPAGTFVQYHVHNHGVNSWNLIEITAGPPP